MFMIYQLKPKMFNKGCTFKLIKNRLKTRDEALEARREFLASKKRPQIKIHIGEYDEKSN